MLLSVLISSPFLMNYSFGQEDTYNKKISKVIIIDAATYSTVNTGLYFLWYKNYKQSRFHWFDDSNEWLQVDKFGHSFSSYYMSRIINQELLWAGIDNKRSTRLASSIGFAVTSTIEIYDGFSDKWGASWSDLSANFIGSSLFLLQEEIWQEQRITPKFSFQKTVFTDIRPNTLGSNIAENILKDYNGQTYWLSVNINSFSNNSRIPKWLNLSFGYGANGMLGGKNNNITLNNIYYGTQSRERQFYLSFDIALDRIKTKSKFANKILKTFNVIKIPLPALELRSGNLYYHWMCF